MLTNLWYVAEFSKNVADKTVRTRLLGQNFVLFSDRSGKINCLSDICIHSGCAMSNVWTNERD